MAIKPTRKKPESPKRPCNCNEDQHAAGPTVKDISFRLSRLEQMQEEKREDEMLQRERNRANKAIVKGFMCGIAAGLWLCVGIMKWKNYKY